MADALLQHCLSLCEQARDGKTNALNELQAALRLLVDTAPPGLPLQARILEQLREPIVTMDLSGYITSWNRAAEALFGYSPDEAIGQHVLFLYADDDGDSAAAMPELFLDSGSGFLEVCRRKKSGEVFWAGLSLSTIFDQDGDPLGLVAHLSEETDRRTADEMLRLQASVIQNSDQGILITDARERIMFVNPAFSRITGYATEEAVGQTPDLLRSGVHTADFREQVQAALAGAAPWQGEIIGKRKSGELFPQSVSITVVRNDQGDVSHAFSIFSDISVLRATEERMRQLANYDPLTGLPNRSSLNQLVTQAIIGAQRSKAYGALLVIDLYRFTSINDTLGHAVGDELLRQAAKRFRGALRAADVLARVGGDEFVAGLFDIQKREHCAIVAQKLLAALNEPFFIGDNELHVGASIGISTYPEDGADMASLIQFADVAMKRVQKNGDTGYLFYGAEMNSRAKEQLRLETELRSASAKGELMLYYQPKVSMRSGRIAGAEALIRWKHPERGMVSPAHFIPIAEETGLILEIGTWILDESCRQVRAWLDAGIKIPPIAINLSARQFDPKLPERIQAVLEKYAVEPRHIRLEITESLLVRGAEDVIAIMNKLVAMGLALSLDDFGTGYSSLSYLKKFPISTLKIDRSFVIGIPEDQNDCAIARAIVTMGQQMRQEIVAEGVETEAQLSFLRDIGCDQLQGYLFSQPISADDFSTMLQQDRRLKLPA